MANVTKYIDKITVPSGSDTITANLVDNASGYTKNTGTVTSVATGTGLTGGPITVSGTVSIDTSYAVTASDITTGTDTTPKLISAKTFADAVGGLGGGTVTSVGISGTSPISASGTVTSTGTLSVSHEASGVTAQSTQALYPFKVNNTGHITEVGTAVTVKEPAYILTYNTTVDATAVQNAYNDNIPIYVSYSKTVSGITTYYLCPLYNYTVFQNNIYLWFGTSYLWYDNDFNQTTVNSLAITYTTTNGWDVDDENAVFPTATSELYNDAGFVSAIIRTWSDS